MWKKTIIFGIILLLTGTAALSWALVEQRKEKQLLQEQLERLDAKLTKLDKLIADEIDIHSFAKVISIEDWQHKLNRHKTKKKTRDLVLNTGIVCILAGGAVFTWWLLLWTARLVICGIPWLSELTTNVFGVHKQIKDKQSVETDEKKDNEASEQRKKPRWQRIQLKKRSKTLAVSGWHNFNKENAEKIAVLYTDEASVKAEESLKPETSQPSQEPDTEQVAQVTKNIRKTAVSDTHEKPLKCNDSRKEQAAPKKQTAEFKQITGKLHKTAQESAAEQPEPLNDSLKELTQQVAAIREYASDQQQRLNKLQDGYDWNITRTFCLRIIRCIDNLENRIAQLSEQNINAPNLEEIRDELIFSLESSSVEQFQPEIKSDYRGQEKGAEAVKEKEPSENTNLKGKIAKIIRPGYQYVIDDDNIRVVRPARVMLFG